jgi:AraC-like DNA-binding protein
LHHHCLSARPIGAGRLRHAPGENLPRHGHDRAFAALVLAGGYVEAGDTGRHRLEAGDVLVHREYEGHLDRFDARGAEVLILPIPEEWDGPCHGRVADMDSIARAAEKNAAAAAVLLREGMTPQRPGAIDWPELLAQSLRSNPALELGEWAATIGVHKGSLSRGFRLVFGMTPEAFRLVQRTHRAITVLARGPESLAVIAQDCGFADQAHMTRSVARLTGATPARLRRAAQSGRRAQLASPSKEEFNTSSYLTSRPIIKRPWLK